MTTHAEVRPALPAHERRALTTALAAAIEKYCGRSSIVCGSVAHFAMKLVEHPADFFDPAKVALRCDTFAYQFQTFYAKKKVWVADTWGPVRIDAWPAALAEVWSGIPEPLQDDWAAIAHHVTAIRGEDGNVFFVDFSSAQFPGYFPGPTICYTTSNWWDEAEPLFKSYAAWRRKAGLPVG